MSNASENVHALNATNNVVKEGGTQGGDNAAAIAAATTTASGKVVVVPFANDDSALPSSFPGVALEYNGDHPVRNTHVTTTSGTARKTIRTQFEGSHSGTNRVAFNIQGQAIGSGTNGPASADYGVNIAVHKLGYAGVTSPIAGEIDGLSIYIRQDGPKGTSSGASNSSDAAGILVNTQIVEDAGFLACYEGSSSVYDRGTAAITRQVQTQIGVFDQNQVGTPAYGFATVAGTGTVNHAFYAGTTGTGVFTNILHAPNSVTIDSTGNYRAPNSFWPNGSWSVVRASAENGATQFTHRGTGALAFVAQDSAAIQFGTSGTIRWVVDSSGNMRPETNLGVDVGTATRRVSQAWLFQIDVGSTSSDGVKIRAGAGTPEGVVSAPVGSLYLRTDGGVSTTLYVKQSGTGNTGWAAK